MDTATATTPRTATEVIDRVREARDAEHAAAVEQIRLAVEWALLHPCPDSEWPAHWGEAHLFDETVTPLAGAGAPLVEEFAPASLAAALGISLDAGRHLLADSLELVFRLPRLWELVVAGVVPVWRARAISRETHDLGVEAVAFADRVITAVPDRIGQVDAARLIEEARLYFDPDRAIAEEEHELTRRGVWVKHHGNPATTDIVMTLETPDALLFDQTIGRIAHDLGALGDTEDLDHRRATAVGILADPQHALDLLSGTDGAAPTRGGSGAMDLFLHLTPADLPGDQDAQGTGAVSVERLGAITTRLLADWLARHTAAGGRVHLRPVIDLGDETTAVDRHDPPEPMREHVILRDAHCVFPGCRRDSRGCDLETHTAWDYKRLDHGGYTWTAPTGHQYDVHPASRRPPRRA